MNLGRRQFLWAAGATVLGFAGLRTLLSTPESAQRARGFGDLQRDPEGILDLPPGFSYVGFSEAGTPMDDGLRVPGAHDGMAAFSGPQGRTILIRNHELSMDDARLSPYGPRYERVSRLDPSRYYDAGWLLAPAPGGTTTVVYDPATRRVERQFLSLAGTLRNCGGGATPWGSWLSCEETVQRAGPGGEKDHGYAFEVPAAASGPVEPLPLIAMGRFNREAVAIDAASGCVYQTEDRGGLASARPQDRGLGLFYRFIPKLPGRLAEGGRLEALKIRDLPGADTTHWTGKLVDVGRRHAVDWVALDEPESPNDDLRHQGRSRGAAGFSRGEGIWAGADGLYFCCTDGGRNAKGQIWRYRPSSVEGRPDEAREPGTLELFAEPNASSLLENGDNLTLTPWGDLLICEDGPSPNGIVGVTPEGRFYRFAVNALNDSEFAGATFSPDGRTFFVNLYKPGWTFAIQGPGGRWPGRSG